MENTLLLDFLLPYKINLLMADVLLLGVYLLRLTAPVGLEEVLLKSYKGWATCSSVVWVPIELILLMKFILFSGSIPDKDDLGKIGSEATDLPENEFLDIDLAKDIATVPLLVSIMDSKSVDSSFLGGIASSNIQFSGNLTCSHSMDLGTTKFPFSKSVTKKVVVPFGDMSLVVSSLRLDTTVFIAL
ncbi:hypothetical protein GH714_029252 [Hevea brasiliensis]|uniref:Uncharacterized protein n=1 Tax=Hevea brasiliensis TaxID=3981 RepID=A0A6A6KCY0_HEVBR|nr:hypothetical protein GH714_029252 [Hevea brasiliensis]